MRIMVMGYSGSGKSTLAAALGKKYSIPVLHLDCVHFQKDWQERSREKSLYILEPYMEQPHWVIDGNYTGLSLEERVDHADRIIILKLPRLLCLRGVLRRYRKYKGVARPSMASGCKEKLDLPFLWWVLFRGRRQHLPIYNSIENDYPAKCIVCRSRRAVKKLLKQDLRH